MHDVYIGLGSNLDSPIKQILSAISNLKHQPTIRNVVTSSLYTSKPVGPQDQPDFVNAVAHFNTELDPITLLDILQKIEQDHHRMRLTHWGPRTLDLDLLLYNNENIHLPRLTIPHPHMLDRGFVIKPLSELAPNLLLSNGKTVIQHLCKIDSSDLTPIQVNF